jgi:hypothetical protein
MVFARSDFVSVQHPVSAIEPTDAEQSTLREINFRADLN